jgi:hypothetical protein
MLKIFQKRIWAVSLIGLLLTAACVSQKDLREIETPPGTVNPAPQKTGLAVFNRELKIPLWEDLPPGVENIPSLTVELELIDLAGDPGERFFQDTLYRGLSVQDYADELVRIQTIEYREMGEEVLKNPRIVNSAVLNWSYTESLEALIDSPRILAAARNRAFYNGGAHGNYDTTYFVFDRESIMRVRLSDIIREESRPALMQLVNRELRTNKGLGPRDSLKRAQFFVDEAELSENFFLSPQGLGFHWDPYEIAPYSEGQVEVQVPFGKLEGFLSPWGLELVQELRGK